MWGQVIYLMKKLTTEMHRKICVQCACMIGTYMNLCIKLLEIGLIEVKPKFMSLCCMLVLALHSLL